jgi:uncharacterized protein YrrD
VIVNNTSTEVALLPSRPLLYNVIMLKLSESLLDKPVMSLRTGQPVATTRGLLLNPNNLKIEGFYCEDRFSKQELILLYQDIRDVIAQGFVINDHDVLAKPDDLVRLRELIKLDFVLLGKPVATISKKRLGKVVDFATEIETMYIQKIYVSQGLIKGLTGGGLGIDRNQINEITDRKIIVNDPLDSGAVRAGAVA